MKFELETIATPSLEEIPFEDKKTSEDKVENIQDDKVENTKEETNVSTEPSVEENKDDPKEKYWGKLKKEREAKRLLQAELDEMRLERIEMEKILRQSLNAGAAHYQTAVESDLAKAQASLEWALDEGNTKDVAAATAAISKATHALHEAQKATSQKFPEENFNDPAAYEQAAQFRLYDWLESNPDLDKDSAEFDKNLTDQVFPFILKLENKMKATNKDYMIGSPQYYNVIDEYIDKLKSKGSNGNKHFGSVRGKVQDTEVRVARPRQLTREEEKAARAFGHTDERYLQILDIMNNQEKGK
ncbi:hypothetical protein UFOVP1311_69 [uncultured Caudovirales phage]|uniref:Uncharacterized protein n=1 Tax=uncultured Caudovirales phage TaxID=2100421 RepID=A0A6J5RQJ8_9CAUD|nr:hypothetical protein UFOVP1311_69 [uncultured Caudovirales phage]